MFLMFHLRRPDVLPVGDLGIRRAVMLRYGLDELPGTAELAAIAEPWRPHRTLACRLPVALAAGDAGLKDGYRDGYLAFRASSCELGRGAHDRTRGS